VNAAEILFLAIGLSLGVAVGAALLDLVRARPAPREVRLTITRNAMPARDAVAVRPGEITAELGPAGPEPDGRAVPAVDRVPVMVARGVDPAYAAIRQEREPALVGAVALAAAAGPPDDRGSMAEGRGVVTMGADQGRPTGDPGPEDGGDAPAATTEAGTATAGTDPCAAQRRLTDERCAVARRAAEQAAAAADNLRHTRRAYDEVARRIEEAQQRADPRAVEAAKEAARAAFRSARDRATSRADLELGATIWLSEINRINISTRDASMLISREQADAAALLASIVRQAHDADAARITAEAAQEGCAEARTSLAACESGDLQAAARSTGEAAPALTVASIWDREDGHQPEIARLLRGEAATRERLVAQLAGSDQDEQRRYQIWLSELVDAIFAASIETATLDFPDEHPFWSGFERSQSRDIVVALASLGYRFDGMGGFSSDRVPGQRELSLAVGYAALDPMRIRNWPTAAEMPDLFSEVTVAADEFLAMRAPDLELGEMVAILGLRSEQLSELWNRWGRLRPLLLEVR
jgi:hypothetical protein